MFSCVAPASHRWHGLTAHLDGVEARLRGKRKQSPAREWIRRRDQSKRYAEVTWRWQHLVITLNFSSFVFTELGKGSFSNSINFALKEQSASRFELHGVRAFGSAPDSTYRLRVGVESWSVAEHALCHEQSFGILTVSSMVPPRQPQPAASPAASPSRAAFFYATIYVVALAQDFHKPNAQALGADQFPRSAPDSIASGSSFFNWLHFSMSWGLIVAVVALSYVQDNVGWAAGFGASWAMMLVSLSVFLLGTGRYRVAEQPRDRRALARLTKRLAATARAWTDMVFRRSTAMDAECLLTPKEQEGKGIMVKLLPIWMTSVAYAMVIAQVSTLFTKQGSTMDRRIGTATGLVVPPAALQSFVGLAIIASVPVYDRAFVPLARRVTRHSSGITMLQRIGAGMAIASVAMAVAALVEAARLRAARDAGLVDSPGVVPMSLWWMVPQYVLLGLANVFTIVGLEEFFYDQVPDALRSVGLALCMSIMGVGSYASGVLVSAIDWATRRTGESWFSDNLNRAHLDYFYWALAGVAALEVFVFLYFSTRYVYINKCGLVM